ncbi:MAG: YnbE family lipoprotein, partial [Gammaproteobacteria bacterium]|nr:YnbE family lipoprotein [Gammaproteobacteria bacterium]
EKPIEINMNVKIEHEIRIKVEQDIDALLTQKPGLF